MAYKFQLGAFTASGSLTAEGNLLAKDSVLTGSSLAFGGTAVSSTAAELNLVDGSSAGTIVNSKAVIYGSSGEVNATTLQIAGNSITATAAELNVLDGLAQGRVLVGDGTGAASILDASGDTKMLIGNGTTLTSVAFSGDINVANDGTATIQANAVEGSMLNSNTVSGAINLANNKLGLTGSALGLGLNFEGDHSHVEQIFVDIESLGALGGSGIAQSDKFMFSDDGDLKKVTFSNLEDAIFGNVSGDIQIAAGGAATLQANAVEGTMLNSNTVSGAINLANDKIGLSGSVAGEGLFFTGDHSHVTTLAVGAGNGISVAGSLVSLQLDTGANGNTSFAVSGDGLSLKSNVAGAGIALASGVLSLDIDELTEAAKTALGQSDMMLFSDGGTEKKITFSNVEDKIFENITGGDVHGAAAGVLTIQANAVEGSMLNSNTVSGAINLADNKLGLSGSVAGNGLKFQNALQNGFGDHSHIEKLAVQLESSNALSVSSNGLDLKGTIAGDRTFSGDLKVGGDLFVTGTTITVDSTSIMVTGSITFEGSTGDGNETTLGVIDPDADRTINLANASGTLIPFAAASTTTISSTPAELNLLDGSAKSTSSITIADADGFIIIDGTTTKQIPASDIKTYIGNTSNLDVALKDNTQSLAVGVNYFADLAVGGEACALPASPSVGDAVYLKAPSNCSSERPLTLATDTSSHKIDGADQIVLESPHAAVMCVYVVADVWKVF